MIDFLIKNDCEELRIIIASFLIITFGLILCIKENNRNKNK